MSARPPSEGPQGFADQWLRFDPARPVRFRLLWRFIAGVIGLLAACALLALSTR